MNKTYQYLDRQYELSKYHFTLPEYIMITQKTFP
jgi:carbonic anhydrase